MRGQLKTLNPYSILNRGYAMLFDPEGCPLTDASGAPPGTPLTARLARGALRVRSEGVAEE